MARKKTILKEQILNGAYDFVSKNGFSNLTARSLAAHIGSSTQPIYLEFQNMSDLKKELYAQIYQNLENQSYLGDSAESTLTDLALNIIQFSKVEPKLYQALLIDDNIADKQLHDFSYQLFEKVITNNPKYKDCDQEAVASLLNGIWIVTTGLATLGSTGAIVADIEAQRAIITETINLILTKKETFSDLKS
ncbi:MULTISPECIES: TetR/AcrR family transcriptional regulator [unclassified Enterococcus]|uniref:TetR/AcrR family transcriptional regulator n=1 Tax=unclassified Enterococcus TaxID=2608891 RepID=UPI001551C175|nr:MULTISPECIES: TetR/AcrR family transcriptional regulator [unclassified Enterococcus]MBS7576180.1 TetR/AcrR family transcriptional regulator [Enterococcus sp. MMGLQ5-2]MBS7583413.1 TetR/AcrR family transcriptional regulator [Enterococcus sp. MMGLQ5-1]NPD11273.1 TetR/AcrR family transcriptional regulator [Enterococcus sp. MMGLQ5-1]NPD36016.1 TetR/AcrR family transcriptional regulator [Enterococcus sp. MMGLQ5-2]